MTDETDVRQSRKTGANDWRNWRKTTLPEVRQLSPVTHPPLRGVGTGALAQTGSDEKNRTGATGLAHGLAKLARQVERLAPPSHRDPERFWRDKSDLAHALRALAREGH